MNCWFFVCWLLADVLSGTAPNVVDMQVLLCYASCGGCSSKRCVASSVSGTRRSSVSWKSIFGKRLAASGEFDSWVFFVVLLLFFVYQTSGNYGIPCLTLILKLAVRFCVDSKTQSLICAASDEFLPRTKLLERVLNLLEGLFWFSVLLFLVYGFEKRTGKHPTATPWDGCASSV